MWESVNHAAASVAKIACPLRTFACDTSAERTAAKRLGDARVPKGRCPRKAAAGETGAPAALSVKAVGTMTFPTRLRNKAIGCLGKVGKPDESPARRDNCKSLAIPAK
jgi:hypothetical protein